MNSVVLIVKHEFADVWFVNELYVPCEQFTYKVDANGQNVPTKQPTHASADVWFLCKLYVPALQFTKLVVANGQ